jgi:hypothetical protein
MTHDTFDRRLGEWLEIGPTSAPGDVIESIGIELPGIRRRPRGVIALTSLAGERGAGRVVAVAAVVVVAVAAVLVIPRDDVGAPPAVAPTALASGGPAPVVPSAAPLITMPPADSWAPVASTVNRYHVNLPAGWTWTPATEPWVSGTTTAEDSPWLDRATSRDGRLEFFGRATDLSAPMTLDDWIAAYETQTGTCSTPEDWVPLETAVGDWAVREICGRFVGLGVVDGTRGIVLSLRPTVMQPTRAQIDEDGTLFESIIASFANGG